MRARGTPSATSTSAASSASARRSGLEDIRAADVEQPRVRKGLGEPRRLVEPRHRGVEAGGRPAAEQLGIDGAADDEDAVDRRRRRHRRERRLQPRQREAADGNDGENATSPSAASRTPRPRRPAAAATSAAISRTRLGSANSQPILDSAKSTLARGPPPSRHQPRLRRALQSAGQRQIDQRQHDDATPEADLEHEDRAASPA